MSTVDDLLNRSRALGSDPRNTNYAGGNTSAKAVTTDPVTAKPVELMWVKGSGGDLGTLTAAGLAVLRVDRLRALVDVDELHRAQRDGDVLGANAVLMDAYNTDVRPLLAELREEMGLDPDPVAAYTRSGYFEKIRDERKDGQAAGWGA